MQSPDPIAGLDGLYFAAKHLVDGLYTGKHASPLRGTGIEFHDYRPYAPGDDLRTVDWKLFGRTDRYYLKRYRRETDLNLQVLVDGSASMNFASLHPKHNSKLPTKFKTAQQLSAALLTLALRQGDRAGLAVFDQSLRHLHPATGSLRQLRTMIADLEGAAPAEGAADLPTALGQFSGALGSRKSAILIISDLLDEPDKLLGVFDRLRFAGHEVIVFQVLTPDELALPTETRGLRMRDLEQGSTVNTQPRAVANAYRKLIQDHIASVRRSLKARGMDHLLVNTAQPLLGVLRGYLNHRSVRTR